MPRHEHFPQYLVGLPHMETQLHYPVLDGLGLLDPAVAKAEMARDPKLRAFAKETHDCAGQGIQAGGDQGIESRRVPAPCAGDGLTGTSLASTALRASLTTGIEKNPDE